MAGAAGQRDFAPHGGKPSAGPQEHEAASPAHGAGGGASAHDLPWRGNPPMATGKTGLSFPDPEAGSGKPYGKVGDRKPLAHVSGKSGKSPEPLAHRNH